MIDFRRIALTELDFDKMDKASLLDFCKRVFSKDAVATDIIREDKPLRNAEHPTMKPIPLMGRFVRNSTRRGGAGYRSVRRIRLDTDGVRAA